MNENKIHVAVVDDDESFGRAIGRLLRAAGFETAIFPSAEDYLQDDAHESFNCLVLDIQLGGLSGLDLGRRLADQGGKIPVIYISALDENEIGATVRQISCAAFLPKPVSGRMLIGAIRRAVHPDENNCLRPSLNHSPNDQSRP